MKKVWFDEAWADYLYWQSQDKKTLKRINELLRDIERSNFDGIGKPEPLKGELSGFWSRRIDATNRFVYRIENGVLEILSCKGHYEDWCSGDQMCAGVSKIGGAVRRQLGEFPQQERTNVPVMLPLMRWFRWRRRTILHARSKTRDKRECR